MAPVRGQSHTRSSTSGGWWLRAFGGIVAVAMLLALFLAGCGGSATASAGSHLSGGGTPSTQSTGSSGLQSSGSASPSGSAGSAGNGANAGATPAPFKVTGVTVDASPINVDGVCTPTMPMTWAVTITAPPGTAGGTVSYIWARSIGVESDPQTVTFAPGQTSVTVSDTWNISAALGNGNHYAEALTVLAPNTVSGNYTGFTFHCVFRVVAINASFTPTTYNCQPTFKYQLTQKFTFKAVITVTPGPATTFNASGSYGYVNPNGASLFIGFGASNIPVAGGATTAMVSISLLTLTSSSANGTYEAILGTTTPNSVTSNAATVTKQC